MTVVTFKGRFDDGFFSGACETTRFDYHGDYEQSDCNPCSFHVPDELKGIFRNRGETYVFINEDSLDEEDFERDYLASLYYVDQVVTHEEFVNF